MKKRGIIMKIIDAHLHFCPEYPHFDELARAAGHENTAKHLKKEYERLGIVMGIVMGNRGLSLEEHQYPDFLRYCIGLDGKILRENRLVDSYALIEQHLKRESCVGIKLYPGYNKTYITDESYEPVYELAAAYQKPVAVHMGQTAGPRAYLKYSHPLTMDEAAVRHPEVQFVMCHFGNPWLMDAAAVVEKNDNVAADLSGILVGKMEFGRLLERQRGYFETFRTWVSYCDNYGKFMFGTDWPLANYEESVDFVKWLVPEEYHESIFYGNAARIYKIQQEKDS